MNELALFAGAGGGLLATKWLLGFKAVCYVENNPYRVEVLKTRIRDGLLDDAPIWDDARTFNGRPWRGCVDIVTAGFPCQPFSVAGKRKGAFDERNLWPDTIRIIREVRPTWCLLENVPGLLSGSHGYFGQILRDLAEGGYDVRWRMLSAAEVGAPHKRNRIWIVAHAESCCSGGKSKSNKNAWLGFASSSERFSGTTTNEDVAHTEGGDTGVADRQHWRQGIGTGSGNSGRHTDEHGQKEDVAHANDQRLEGQWTEYQLRSTEGQITSECRGQSPRSSSGWWAVEPDVGRVAHGVARRVDRLKALGDGQVPAVVKVVWELLTNE